MSTAHVMLNLICKTTEMDCQPIEQLPPRLIYGKVADQRAFGSVPTKLFELFLTVHHDGPDDSGPAKLFLVSGARFDRIQYFAVGTADGHGPPGVLCHSSCQCQCFLCPSEVERDH